MFNIVLNKTKLQKILLNNNKRINWIDQLKGFGIILVVYGHNFPIIENYIYSFHMPLFFFIAGLFHPKKANLQIVKKRAKQILVPYFLWSFILFIFWFFIGRKFGESALLNLSVEKNFIGVFFAQGDIDYMNWGIPMWFLPSIFLSFLVFSIVLKIKKRFWQLVILFLLICFGFLIPRFFNIFMFWSLDVSLVALSYYSFGFYYKQFIISIKNKKKFMLLFLGVLHILTSLFLAQKVDMYRSNYGNEFLFLLVGFIGVLFWAFLIKEFQPLKVLAFFGKNTIPILATQIRVLTFIKLILYLFVGVTVFNFTEFEKILLVFVQLAFMYPIILFTNKYIPFLNGKNKKI